jgi:hypothetical protein
VVQIHPPQPIFSISYSLSVPSVPLIFRSYCQQLPDNLPVRGPFLVTHGLGVYVHYRGDVGMPQEFLLHLHIGVVRTLQARIRVPQGVPVQDTSLSEWALPHPPNTREQWSSPNRG